MSRSKAIVTGNHASSGYSSVSPVSSSRNTPALVAPWLKYRLLELNTPPPPPPAPSFSVSPWIFK